MGSRQWPSRSSRRSPASCGARRRRSARACSAPTAGGGSSCAASLTVLTLVPAYLLWDAGEDASQTVLFTSIAFAELAGGFAMRSERVSLRRLGVFSNLALVGAVALTVALQVLLVVPFPRDLLGLQPLTAAQWLLVAGIALTYLVVVEFDKALHSRATRSAAA